MELDNLIRNMEGFGKRSLLTLAVLGALTSCSDPKERIVYRDNPRQNQKQDSPSQNTNNNPHSNSPMQNQSVIIKEKVRIKAIADAYVSEDQQTKNYGNEIYLIVSPKEFQGRPSESRAYIQFPSIQDYLPKNKKIYIDKAKLKIWTSNDASITSNPIVNVHSVLSPWEESSITWQYQPRVESSVTDFNQQISSDGNQKKFDITSAVRNWIREEPEYGFMINAVSAKGIAAFLSKEFSGGTYKGVRTPEMEILYEYDK